MRGGALGKRTLEERLARKIELRLVSDVVDDECHVWVGALTGSVRGGYAHIRIHGISNPVLVHRLVYELAHGPVPDGMEIDHVCEVKACVRLSHLEAVTHVENCRRHYARRRRLRLAA